MIATAFFMLLAMAACASAQVTLSTVEDGVATPVGQAVSISAPWRPAGDVADVVFNIDQYGQRPIYLPHLLQFAAGYRHFSVRCDGPCGARPHVPATIPPGGLNFTVRFQPNQVAQSYSATLNVGDADNPITVVLIGQSVPGFTVVAANQPLSAGGTVGFASVPVGSSQTVLMTLANQTSGPLTVGAIAIQGSRIQLAGIARRGPAAGQRFVRRAATGLQPHRHRSPTGYAYHRRGHVPAQRHGYGTIASCFPSPVDPTDSRHSHERAAGESFGQPGIGIGIEWDRDGDARLPPRSAASTTTHRSASRMERAPPPSRSRWVRLPGNSPGDHRFRSGRAPRRAR